MSNVPGKSTLARILRFLIDPQTSPVLALPSSTENLMATAVNGWLLAYENISAIPDWLSDCVCQLAFGGGFASRTLFTNDERSVIYAQRPVILVGITDFVLRGDLRDRSVFLHMTAIPDDSTRSERTFWPEFRADYPRILGGVLDAIVGGLRELPSVDLKTLPRMADYAEWGEAAGRGLGWGAGAFMSTYNDNRKEATEALLEDSPVASVVLGLAPNGMNFSCKPQKFYEQIMKFMGDRLGPNWPKTVSAFSKELRRIAPQLRVHGISITFERKSEERIVTLRSGYPQRTTPSSQPPSGFVTITHPHHPLRGQRVEIVRIRRGNDPDLIVVLPDGRHTAIALSSTDYDSSPEIPPAPAPAAEHLLDLDGLRRVIQLLDRLAQPGHDRLNRRRSRSRRNRPNRGSITSPAPQDGSSGLRRCFYERTGLRKTELPSRPVRSGPVSPPNARPMSFSSWRVSRPIS